MYMHTGIHSLLAGFWLSSVVSGQRCLQQSIYLSEDDFEDVFTPVDNNILTDISGINCVYTCLHMSNLMRSAVYANVDRKCSCLKRMLTTDDSGTKEVHFVDLNRTGKISVKILMDNLMPFKFECLLQ